MVTSGIRLGTPAMTTRGFREEEAVLTANLIADVLEAPKDAENIADARFLKPLDEELIAKLAHEHELLITIEESGIGGFGSHVATFLAGNGLLDGKLKFRPLMIPDTFVEQASQADMYAAAGLDRTGIVATVLTTLGISDASAVRANT